MRVVRKQAYQAHPVPETAGYPKGPFSAEVLAPPVIDHEPLTDEFFPDGATAQNQYQGSTYYRCRLCKEILEKSELSQHDCGGDDGTG